MENKKAETGSKSKEILRYYNNSFITKRDDIVTEAPLNIVLRQYSQTTPLLITMRTPINDIEMVYGYLYVENIITNSKDILNVRYYPGQTENSDQLDKIIVDINPKIDLSTLNKSFISFSSCGFCGKTNLNEDHHCHIIASKMKIEGQFISNLIENFSSNQIVFKKTGGIHAAAFYNIKGELSVLREDIGRHNALDKIIGHFVKKEKVPATDYIVLLSSRISYEMVSKCLSAGVSTIIGMGPVSTLAIELAEEYGITLIGFVKKESFNVYTGYHKIIQS